MEYGNRPARFIAAWLTPAAGFLVALCAVCGQAETISALLDIDEGPGKNEFVMTFTSPLWSDDETSRPTGDVEIALTIDFDPLSQEPTAVTGIEIIGGSWTSNDLLFSHTFINPSGPDETHTVTATGMGGYAWSVGPSTVTGSTFPASDHGGAVNAGVYQAWRQVEGGVAELLAEHDFAAEPFAALLSPGTGTVTVALTSFDGVTATYDTTLSMDVDLTIEVDTSTSLRSTGLGEASGSFTRVVPEPASLVLLISLIPLGLFALWRRRR